MIAEEKWHDDFSSKAEQYEKVFTSPPLANVQALSLPACLWIQRPAAMSRQPKAAKLDLRNSAIHRMFHLPSFCPCRPPLLGTDADAEAALTLLFRRS